MLGRALGATRSAWLRGRKTPNPYIEKGDLLLKYGRYANYFIEEEDSNVKYVDKCPPPIFI